MAEPPLGASQQQQQLEPNASADESPATGGQDDSPKKSRSLSSKTRKLFGLSEKRNPEPIKLKRAVEELLQTEKNFLQDLHNLHKGYEVKLPAQVLRWEERSVVFRNLSDLISLHETLLSALEPACELCDLSHIANSFTATDFLSYYASFCPGHERALQKLESLQANPVFLEKLVECQLALNNKLTLADDLIKPIQRILKYPLLLSEISRHAPTEGPAGDELRAALLHMQKVAMDVNRIKRQRELDDIIHGQVVVTRTQTLQDRMAASGFEGNIASYGSLVEEVSGATIAAGKQRGSARHLYLFEMALLACKPRPDSSIAVKDLYLLQSCSVEVVDARSFSIVDTLYPDSKTVYHSSRMDAPAWVARCKALIKNLPSSPLSPPSARPHLAASRSFSSFLPNKRDRKSERGVASPSTRRLAQNAAAAVAASYGLGTPAAASSHALSPAPSEASTPRGSVPSVSLPDHGARTSESGPGSTAAVPQRTAGSTSSLTLEGATAQSRATPSGAGTHSPTPVRAASLSVTSGHSDGASGATVAPSAGAADRHALDLVVEPSSAPATTTAPATAPAAAAAVPSDPTLEKANKAKDEGNRFFKEGKFRESIASYEEVRQILNGNTNAEAVRLVRVCRLNAAQCHLKLNEYELTITACDEVIEGDATSHKAFHRRGLAREQRGDLRGALADLRRAHALDNTQAVYREHSERVALLVRDLPSDAADVEDIDDVELPVPTPAAVAAATTQAAPSAPAAAAAPVSTPSTALPTAPKISQEQIRAAKEIAEDPIKLDQAMSSMRNISDAEAQMIALQSGMPIEQVRMARSMLAAMPPEVAKAQFAAASRMMESGTLPGMPGAATAPSPAPVAPVTNTARASTPSSPTSPTATVTPAPTVSAASTSVAPTTTSVPATAAPFANPLASSEAMQAAQAQLREHPEMLQAAMQQMRDIDDDTLAAMGQQMGMNVAQLRMARQMMANMSPEMMQSMASMRLPGMPPATGGAAAAASATNTGASSLTEGGAGAGPVAGAGMGGSPFAAMQGMDTSAMMDMLSNPEMAQQVSAMMQSMDPKAMAEMCKSMGMDYSEENMRMLKESVSPKTIESMMKWVGRAKKVAQAAKKTKEHLLGTWVRAAITILVIAVLIAHFFGWA
eukprot:m.95201 g.95201  ORF g.95201 m.95201 type:complete len:1140 (+) comp13886_c1_seq2:127-3546(+)